MSDEPPEVTRLAARVAQLERELAARTRLLEESDERFRALVQGGFEGLAVSVDGRIVEANDAFIQHTRAARADVIGRSLLDFATEQSRAVVRAHVEQRNENGYEVVALRADGTTFPCEVLGRNIVYRGRPARITAVRDLSERRRIETEKRELSERLNESLRLESLGMIAGGVAHDFNNLLAVILGHAGLAQKALDPDSDAAVHLLQVQTAATRASDLTNQLLTYAGRRETSTVPVDLGEIAHDIAGLLRVTVSPKARLVLDLDPAAPTIDADPAQLRQLIMNLIANASDALGDNAGEIRVRTSSVDHGPDALRDVHLDATVSHGRRALLEIEDTGSGIEPDALKRIFDPFFTTKFAGRGLGLATVLGIVRAHRGAIAVTSRPGQGSRFTVYFPASARRAEPIAEVATAPRESFRATGLALIADDEPLLSNVIEAIVTALGFDVVRAGDGEEALDLFRARSSELALVLLDLTMPKRTGAEVLTAMRRAGSTTKVVMMSGYPETRARPGPPDPHTRFVAKPFTEASLVSTIRTLFE